MSLDYRKKTYRPSRPNTRNITSYGSMSKWISRQHENPAPRPEVARHLMERANPSPQFTKKRPIIKPSPTGMPSMYDTYMNKSSAVLDETLPVHLRYSNHCGYDDFHKAFRAVQDKHPELSYPHFGPPSPVNGWHSQRKLRHGRQGGSWRHVREVLQAGGNRIVFVDGQVSSDDLMKLDSIPGGHLILPEVDRGTPSPRLVQQMNRLYDNSVAISTDRRVQQVPLAKYSMLESQRALEKDNWNIMR
ncbi:uncharacterized protein LOC101862746 [Aplysia californica]|uniref:Uncharacterized protein LOC101862746 n=1 Tax=Aplysia californica TaxID=6500 RepID=A0ABM0JZ37_APLCA|nr:uncharacterized protein LOC101862746 [Aplysia californica]